MVNGYGMVIAAFKVAMRFPHLLFLSCAKLVMIKLIVKIIIENDTFLLEMIF